LRQRPRAGRDAERHQSARPWSPQGAEHRRSIAHRDPKEPRFPDRLLRETSRR
jgi:hypothetical protein